LAPEHLVICKAAFDRPKDWLDIEQILVSAEQFEVEEVERWLLHLVGEDDHRKKRFDQLATELRGP
jgi:hypothetical protein